MRVLGEAQLDKDGVLHGWCWSPDAPKTRLSVEILANEAPVAQIQASRFREDLRARGMGDGYSGFNITLTRLASGTSGVVLAARETQSGTRFWQALRGKLALPGHIPARLLAARRSLAEMGAAVAALSAPGAPARSGEWAGAWPVPGGPISLWLAIEVQGLAGLRRSARNLAAAGIMPVLTGPAPCAGAPAGLAQLAWPGETALQRAGRVLALCRAPSFGVMLPGAVVTRAAADRLGREAARTLLLAPFLAATLRRIAPALADGMGTQAAPLCEGLLLAGPTLLLRGLGFEPQLDDGGWLAGLDMALRALAAGLPVAEWQAPWTGFAPPGLSMGGEAGQRFAARWPAGLV